MIIWVSIDYADEGSRMQGTNRPATVHIEFDIISSNA